MEVPAGAFETYKIQCGRYKPTELEFFYAPQIGHYVVMRIDDAALRIDDVPVGIPVACGGAEGAVMRRSVVRGGPVCGGFCWGAGR